MNTGSVIAQFTASLTTAVAEPVAVEWYTADGTAKAGVDYAANKGTVVFAPGELTKTIDVLVFGRAVGTEPRSFYMTLLPPSNAILADSVAECVISVDTTGSEPVTTLVIPTGPKGNTGDSAYQTWLTLPGNAGNTEQEFIDSLKPSPEEVAEEVLPLLNVGEADITTSNTVGKPYVDTAKLKTFLSRFALAAPAKIAFTVLAGGDNLIAPTDLTGDTVNFGDLNFFPRIIRGGNIINPAWSLEPSGSILIENAIAGDTLAAVQYDFLSDAYIKALVLRVYADLASSGAGLGDALMAVKAPVAGAIARAQHDKNAELVTGGDLGETPTRNLFSIENNTALGAYAFKSFSFNAVYNCFVGAHAGESIVGSESDIAIGAENTGVGHGAGRRITTGKRNITVGAEAGSLITTGSFNIVIGAQSSSASGEKTGDLNTVVGYNAGKNWTTGERNSFFGSDAGSATTTGRDNVAAGQAAMQNNTTGGGNTYLGAFSGTETGTGGNNLAAGRSALFRNVDGAGNVALGREAALGVSGTGASPNNITVMGFQAAYRQNGLNGVVFCGMQSGYNATTVVDTVLIGRASGFNLTTGSNNVMVGAATGDSETTGTQLVYLGHGAGRFLIDGTPATGKLNCVAIGYQARVGGNHEIQMGNSSQTAYVYGTVQTRSDERDKADVRDIPADVAVSFVRGLRSCLYKFDYRDDYIEEYNEQVGTDAEGKPVYETKIRHLDKDGSKKRTREHAGYLAGQVKELLDKLGFDCGIYQDHLVNEGGCDVKTLAYEQSIPFITKALDVAFTKLDDIENRLSAIEKSKAN